MSRIRTLASRIIFPHTYSEEAFNEYLRGLGAKIGENTRFIWPRKCHIDINRAEYITIGDNCCLSMISILAHDYSWYVLFDSYKSILPDPGGEVVIGNNCFIGYEALILKDVVIGDNVIIGARSVVTAGHIPSNTVWGGCPAKQICTLEEYYEKKKRKEMDAIKKRWSILQNKDHNIMDYGYFLMYFLERTEDNYKSYIQPLEFNGRKGTKEIKEYFFSTPPLWENYDLFIEDMMKRNN